MGTDRAKSPGVEVVPYYVTAFEKYASQGIDIICFTLSAKFSGSYNAALIARSMVLENYPDARITVIDSTLATLMQGLMTQGELFSSGLAHGRAQSRKKAIEKLFAYIEENGNDPNRFAIMTGYGYNIQEGEALRSEVIAKLKQRWPDYDSEVDIGQIGATIGVHTGPHPLGLGLCEKSC